MVKRPKEGLEFADYSFEVTVYHLPENHTYTEQFDHVIIATGHFSTPNVPHFDGFDWFQGNYDRRNGLSQFRSRSRVPGV